MNREILFRGKRKSSRKIYQRWVYGSLLLEKGYCSIQSYNNDNIDDTDVIPKTVGQYTGLKDKNGKRIFEGDIIKGINDSLTVVVTWYDIHAGFNLMGLNTKAFEIIGNIHDNPELLEGA